MIELFQAREGFSSINRASIALVDRALVAYFAEQDERYQAEENLRILQGPTPHPLHPSASPTLAYMMLDTLTSYTLDTMTWPGAEVEPHASVYDVGYANIIYARHDDLAGAYGRLEGDHRAEVEPRAPLC